MIERKAEKKGKMKKKEKPYRKRNKDEKGKN